ncbi:MAG: ABC transporter permease [Parasutterella sp.]
MIVLRYILGFLFLGGCWHAGALALGPDLLPDPVATIRLFAESLSTPEFWGHILVSLWRLTLGLVAAVAVAFLWDFCSDTAARRIWRAVRSSSLLIRCPRSYYFPSSSRWWGSETPLRVLLIALTTGYQVLVIIRAGALSIDPSWVKAFRSMGGTTAEAVRHLYVPAALPALFTSLKVASGTAVAVLFLAESFATTSGLGYLIMDAWGMGDVLFMFNAILGMSLLGLVIYGVIGLLERVCCPWLFAGRK